MAVASAVSREQRLHEALHAYLQAADAGQAPERGAWLRQHPDLADELAAFLDDEQLLRSLARPLRPEQAPTTPPAAEALDAPWPGEHVRYFGDYEVMGMIARGGMGVVYQARQVSLDRVVALKMIRAGQLASPADVARFRAEAQAAATLDHPNILPLYEVGAHDGRPYFTMKLIEGDSLARRAPELGAAPREAARLVAAVARAVHFAHQRGILHRDLKPANVLIDGDGTPYVADFGLAKRIERDAGLTQSGVIVGTASYMAPEQARADKALTTAADVYALGAILYELLAGRPPFRADSVLETLRQVQEEEPVRPRAVHPGAPRDLETICLKCMEKSPARRYGSAEALADDLERWLRGEPIVARPAGALERAAKWARRRPAVAALAAALAVSLIGAAGAAAWFTINLDDARRAALALAGAEAKARRAEQEEKERAEEEAKRTAAALKQVREEKARADRMRDRAEAAGYAIRVGWAQRQLSDGDLAGAVATLDLCEPASRGWEHGYLRRLGSTGTQALGVKAEGDVRLVFSPDARTVARVDGKDLVLLDAATGGRDCRVALKGHAGKVTWLAFQAEGKEVAATAEDNDLRRWDVATGKELGVRRLPLALAWGNALSPDGQRLATWAGVGRLRPYGDRDSEVRLWGQVPGKAAAKRLWQARWPGPNEIRELTFAPDGKHLAGGGWAMVAAWDTVTGRTVLRKPWPGEWAFHVAWSPAGERLAAASRKEVRVWDVRTGRRVRTLRPLPRFDVHQLGFSPTGRLLVYLREGTAFHVWDTDASPEALTLTGATKSVNAVAFRPDGGEVAGVDGAVHFWSPATGRLLRRERDEDGGAFLSLAYSPDGKLVAAGRRGGGRQPLVKLWEASTGRLAGELRGGDGVGVAFSPDGRRLAVTSSGGTAEVWEVAARKRAFTLAGHKGPPGQGRTVWAVAFSPDGKWLVTASEDETVKVWDAATGKELRTLRGLASGVTCEAFSPNGRRLAAGSGSNLGDPRPGDGVVKVWSTNDWREALTLRGHAGSVNGLAFSPDGRRLVSVGGGGPGPADKPGEIKVWEARTGQELLRLSGPGSHIPSVAFSPDGRYLATGTSAGTIKLWDAGPAVK
jgi:WD40 repeat protein/tRNA A-37 threonylcarbamoyl transferase component Bud32